MEISGQNIIGGSAGPEASWEVARREITCFQGGENAPKNITQFGTRRGGGKFGIWEIDIWDLRLRLVLEGGTRRTSNIQHSTSNVEVKGEDRLKPELRTREEGEYRKMLERRYGTHA